jgi:hypothetical protein
VLTLAPDGTQVVQVTCFVTAELLARWGHDDGSFAGATVFPRFGLPAELPSSAAQQRGPSVEEEQ